MGTQEPTSKREEAGAKAHAQEGAQEVQEKAQEAEDKAQDAGSKVQHSTAFGYLITLGLICYGLIHILLGWLCGQVAVGGGGETSPDGALRDLVSKPLGNVLMILFAIGLLALVVWQLIEALFGFRNQDTTQQVRKRLVSAGRAVVYLVLGVTSLRLALGGRTNGSNASAKTASATLMGAPGGQLFVGLVGLVVIAVGISQILRGVRRQFVEEDLKPGVSEWAKKLGMVGWAVKGLAVAFVGALFGWAAITFDPGKAGGMDQALKTVREQPFGMVVLLVMGLGFACFGVYSFVWSRNVNQENI